MEPDLVVQNALLSPLIANVVGVLTIRTEGLLGKLGCSSSGANDTEEDDLTLRQVFAPG